MSYYLPQVNLVRAKRGDFLAFFESRGISGVLTGYGVWDEASIEIALSLLDQAPAAPLVLDIGANLGTFTIPVARHILERGGKVISFEPQQIVRYQLCGNVFLNRLGNVTVRDEAISDLSQVRSVPQLDYKQAWNIGAFSLGAHEGQPRSNEALEVRFLTLNELIDLPKVALIKIDVEGMEAAVIRGGGEFLAHNDYPPILFESRAQDKDAEVCKRLLAELGYSVRHYAPEDCLAIYPNEAHR